MRVYFRQTFLDKKDEIHRYYPAGRFIYNDFIGVRNINESGITVVSIIETGIIVDIDIEIPIEYFLTTPWLELNSVNLKALSDFSDDEMIMMAKNIVDDERLSCIDNFITLMAVNHPCNETELYSVLHPVMKVSQKSSFINILSNKYKITFNDDLPVVNVDNPNGKTNLYYGMLIFELTKSTAFLCGSICDEFLKEFDYLRNIQLSVPVSIDKYHSYIHNINQMDQYASHQ